MEGWLSHTKFSSMCQAMGFNLQCNKNQKQYPRKEKKKKALHPKPRHFYWQSSLHIPGMILILNNSLEELRNQP